MSTIKIENRPNAEGLRAKTKEEFIKEYSEVLKQHKEFRKDVLEFSELMAKHPADIFIVPTFEAGQPCEQIRQGDIYLFRQGNKKDGSLDNVLFAKYYPTISETKVSESMNLQLGESITGDHKIVPLQGTTIKMFDCTIELPVASFRGATSKYKVKMFEADGPFVVAHREHGNITGSEGLYLACTQLDSRSMTRMRD